MRRWGISIRQNRWRSDKESTTFMSNKMQVFGWKRGWSKFTWRTDVRWYGWYRSNRCLSRWSLCSRGNRQIILWIHFYASLFEYYFVIVLFSFLIVCNRVSLSVQLTDKVNTTHRSYSKVKKVFLLNVKRKLTILSQLARTSPPLRLRWRFSVFWSEIFLQKSSYVLPMWILNLSSHNFAEKPETLKKFRNNYFRYSKLDIDFNMNFTSIIAVRCSNQSWYVNLILSAIKFIYCSN